MFLWIKKKIEFIIVCENNENYYIIQIASFFLSTKPSN